MKITVTNTFTGVLSTDVGTLSPGETKSMDMSPEAAYASAAGMKSLRDAGRVLVVVSDEAERLDSMEGGGVSVATATTAPMSLFVTTNGSDSNLGTANSPFLTIQAALDSLPKRIRHLVDINVGIGNFAGFSWSGFKADPISRTLPCGITIRGTLITATLATSTPTGTWTSSVSNSGATLTSFVDSTKSWTSNNLKEKLLEVTAGLGIGEIYPIQSNNATSVFIPRLNQTLGNGTSTYAIKDWGTVITSPVSLPASIPLLGVTAPIAGTTYIDFSDNEASRPDLGSMFVMERIKVLETAVTTQGVFLQGNASLKMHACNFTNSTTSRTIRVECASGAMLSRCVVKSTSSGAGYSINDRSRFGACEASIFIMGATATGIFGLANSTSIVGVYIEGAACGIDIGIGFATGLSFWITGCGRGLKVGDFLGIPSITTGIQNSVVFIGNTSHISNCTIAAMEIIDSKIVINSLTVGSNLVDLILIKGGKALVNSGTVFNGTTEVLIDGTSSTLATMRAANPKLISSPYFSIFYE